MKVSITINGNKFNIGQEAFSEAYPRTALFI